MKEYRVKIGEFGRLACGPESIHPEVTDQYIGLLSDFLKSNPGYFCEKTTVNSIDDVAYFREHTPNCILFPGDRFLVDIYSNELWLCEWLFTYRYDHKRHRKMRILPLARVIDECRMFFPRFNGYWKVPTLDEIKSKKNL